MDSATGLVLRVPFPLVELRDETLDRRRVRLYLKRDDLINPEIPGNKWRKLKHNIAAAKEQKKSTLLPFGGAYSNHIRATAAVGHYFGFRTIGIIRGEEHLPLNKSLAYAVSRGMTLNYLDRTSYRNKTSPGLAGIAASLPGARRALGFSVLKGGRFLVDDVSKLQREALGETTNNWSIEYGFHMGGFARRTRQYRSSREFRRSTP